MTSLLSYVLRFALVFPAIILHEVSHGYVAYLLGDETAKRAGRLSLNPIKHVDPVGTIILPATMLILSGGRYFFGWAKPVPINPWAFKNQREGMLLTGVAGPVTNIVLAALSGLLFASVRRARGCSVLPRSAVSSLRFCVYFCQANLVLAFFNLVPIPPLDGSRVVQYFLPDRLRDAYHSIERYGFMLLIGITWLVPGAFSGYLNLTVEPLLPPLHRVVTLRRDAALACAIMNPTVSHPKRGHVRIHGQEAHSHRIPAHGQAPHRALVRQPAEHAHHAARVRRLLLHRRLPRAHE